MDEDGQGPNAPRMSHFEVEQKLTEEVSGLLYTTRKQAQIIAGLETALRQLRQDEPEARQITFVLSEWKSLTGHTRAKIDATGNRWTLVKKRLASHGNEICLLAVRGMALAPWMHYGQYRLTPCPEEGHCQRKDDITDVFAKDDRFEALADIGRRSEQSASEKMLEAYQRLSVQCDQAYRRWADAVSREEARKLLEYSLPREEQEKRGMVPAEVIDLLNWRKSA